MDIDYKKILNEMTLEEKASLCSGLDFWHNKPVERLGVPSIMVADGPHGLRKENEHTGTIAAKESYPATCFPTAVTQASTWDTALIKRMGEAIASEAKTQQLSTVLGPGVNIKRSPLCGRNFEYFSEDPYLAGEFAAEYIEGVQKSGVGTSIKHYAVNNQEYLRTSINAVADERTLREIYLAAFEKAVKRSQPASVMCSYNRINGVYASDNKWLLTDVLRNEWGFKGIVVSDWGATNDRVEALRAGMDFEMPGPNPNNDRKIVRAVKKGKLSIQELDKVALRMLEFIFKGEQSLDKEYKYDYAISHNLARKIATEGAVLLKNDKNILPLSGKESIAVLGKLAEVPRYQGSGSSRINPNNLVSFIDYISKTDINYEYSEGYTLSESGLDENLIKQAVEVACGKDRVIIFAGLTDSYEAEAYDRSMLEMPEGHNILIEEVVKVNPNVIVVLQCGSPVSMPWLNNVKAVLNTYLTGEANGDATYDLLYGIANPSGKLAETFPLSLNDYIASQYFKGGPTTVEHREGLYVGYRYYESAGKEVLFPFGYGMSYTAFEYGNFKLSSENIKAGEPLTVSFTITNKGKVRGAEIAQVYVSDVESSVYRPKLELKGFSKVFLDPGESKEVNVALDERAFSYYNTDIKDWHIESGDFKIMVGASVKDIKWSGVVTIKSKVKADIPSDLKEKLSDYYNIKSVTSISDESFRNLLDHEIPVNLIPKRGDFHINSTIQDIKDTYIGKLFLKFGIKAIQANTKEADFTTRLVIENIYREVPLRSLCGFSQGIVTDGLLDAIVRLANGKRVTGILKAVGSIPNVLFVFLSLQRKARLKSKRLAKEANK